MLLPNFSIPWSFGRVIFLAIFILTNKFSASKSCLLSIIEKNFDLINKTLPPFGAKCLTATVGYVAVLGPCHRPLSFHTFSYIILSLYRPERNQDASCEPVPRNSFLSFNQPRNYHPRRASPLPSQSSSVLTRFLPLREKPECCRNPTPRHQTPSFQSSLQETQFTRPALAFPCSALGTFGFRSAVFRC